MSPPHQQPLTFKGYPGENTVNPTLKTHRTILGKPAAHVYQHWQLINRRTDLTTEHRQTKYSAGVSDPRSFQVKPAVQNGPTPQKRGKTAEQRLKHLHAPDSIMQQPSSILVCGLIPPAVSDWWFPLSVHLHQPNYAWNSSSDSGSACVPGHLLGAYSAEICGISRD